MKHFLLFLVIFLLFGSCKTLIFKNNVVFKGNVFVSDEFKTPVTSSFKVYDENFNLIKKVDSSFNGDYEFKIDKSFFKKQCYIVVTYLAVVMEDDPFTNKPFVFECINDDDTIPVFIKSRKQNLDFILNECELNTEVVNYEIHGSGRSVIVPFKKIKFKGDIYCQNFKLPINAKVELVNENFKTIDSSISDFSGAFDFLIDSKYFRKDCFFIISDLKVKTETTKYRTGGVIECNNKPDTISLNINSFNLNKKILINQCEVSLIPDEQIDHGY